MLAVSIYSNLDATCSHVRSRASSLIIYLIIIFTLLIACTETCISSIFTLRVLRFYKHIETTIWIWLPSICSRHWKVIYHSIVMFPCCHHVSNALLICVTATELGDLAIRQKTFIKFMMLYCTFNVPRKLSRLITDA